MEALKEEMMTRRFMFNIADGGFTELHSLWQAEQAGVNPGELLVVVVCW